MSPACPLTETMMDVEAIIIHLVFPHIYCGSRHLPLQLGVVLDQVIAACMSNGSMLCVYVPAIDEPSSCI